MKSFVRYQSTEEIEVLAVAPVSPVRVIMPQLYRALRAVGLWPEQLSGLYATPEEARHSMRPDRRECL